MADNMNKNLGANKNTNQKRIASLRNWHKILLLMLYDIIMSNGAYFLALWLRYDCDFFAIDPKFLTGWLHFAPIYALTVVAIFWYMRLYHSVWRFAGYHVFEHILLATCVTAFVHIVGSVLLFLRMPISYYIAGPVFQFVFVFAIRFAYRFYLQISGRRILQKGNFSNIMIIGAGDAGQAILRDIANHGESKERVCCFIDDDSNKWNRYIDGVPITGGRDAILDSVNKYKIDSIYLCIPSASAAVRSEILEICKGTSCALKNLPSLHQLIDGDVTVNSMKDVAVEDLLGREPIIVQMDEINAFIKGKVILVTGGGGSIGSELCRQIAKEKPKQLIVFDIYENNAYAIGLELRNNFPDLNLQVLIGSVRDSNRLNQVFAEFRPDVVYHAAAHKHVPLMEDSPCEAIKNNAVGTYKTAYAAMMNGCKRFVLVSTDKAVNPTNIMGASKRICELVIQSFNDKIQRGCASDLYPIQRHISKDDRFERPMLEFRPQTTFVAVRFGNVLGSNGSVIPLFKEQIAKGGPVTVTHPDIIRYFMTIPEAVSLVLQAGTYAKGGEIFVLDMGSPVKIDSLARNLICLSGLKPDVDIPIVYTGLRPGEKLYEEKLMSEEGLLTTPNHLIHIGKPIPFDADAFLIQLNQLLQTAYSGHDAEVRHLVSEIVPTYRYTKASSAEVCVP